MSHQIVVSNRWRRSWREAIAGGLAAGVLDALKQQGGLWFGWSGEVADGIAAPAQVQSLDLRRGNWRR